MLDILASLLPAGQMLLAVLVVTVALLLAVVLALGGLTGARSGPRLTARSWLTAERGAIGTGATTLDHLPDLPFMIDPAGFAARTRKNLRNRQTIAHVAGSQLPSFKVPQSGVWAFHRIMFVGQVVVSQDPDAGITWTDWPYGLAERIQVRINGSNEAWSAKGTFFHALRVARFPAYEDAVDTFPGAVGGSSTTVADGTYTVHLTFDIPVAVDPQSLGSSLFVQSSAVDVDIKITTAANPTGCTITGNWFHEPHTFDVPYADDGRLIVPDVTRVHGFNEVTKTFAGTGEQEMPLIRSAGQLHRLFIQVDGASKRLTAHPSAASNELLEEVRLEYAGNQVPYNFAPASSLLVTNNEHYGAPLPYRILCLDLVRDNPMRDAIELQGVTDLRLIVKVGSGVSATSGRITVVEETLF